MTGDTKVVESCVGAVLFTDLVGFTEYNDALGDAKALGVLETQTKLANGVVARSVDARIVKELGDGLIIWFATALEGLEGAAELLAAVNSARSSGGFPLAMRMGLHFGEVTPRVDDLIGQTINIAARVSDLAGPGELLVSASVVTECCNKPGTHGLQPVGPVMVKGVSEPIWLHRLTT